MRLRQYVYFAIRSDTVTADQVTAALGLQPDQVMVRGSKDPERVIPCQHGWDLKCDEPGLKVDEQLDIVMQKMTPAIPALLALLDREPDITTHVQVVRYLETDEEDDYVPPVVTHNGVELELAGGQHLLLGFGFGVAAMAFLHRTRATVDVDEYC
jgi:hypothetical protein